MFCYRLPARRYDDRRSSRDVEGAPIIATRAAGVRQRAGRLDVARPLAHGSGEAHNLIGTPYGFWDIAAIAFTQRALGRVINPAKPYDQQPVWVRQIIDRLRDTHELICSQLVDLCYQRAGVHLFTDGRFEGFVSPEDLRALLIEGITEGPQK